MKGTCTKGMHMKGHVHEEHVHFRTHVHTKGHAACNNCDIKSWIYADREHDHADLRTGCLQILRNGFPGKISRNFR